MFPAAIGPQALASKLSHMPPPVGHLVLIKPETLLDKVYHGRGWAERPKITNAGWHICQPASNDISGKRKKPGNMVRIP
jgi:hypothetical protein